MRGRRSWLAERATLTPGRVAVTCNGVALRYGDLAARAGQRARDLRALGVRAGDAVAVLLGNGLPCAELLFAIEDCGAALVPLNARLTARELAHPLRDCGAKLLLHGDGELALRALAACDEIGSVRPVAVAGDGRLLAGPPPAEVPDRQPDPIDALAVLYTSGTTGLPKGTVLTHDNFFASALGSAQHLGVLPGDRWLACMPLFHVGGLSILVRSTLYGGAALIHERFDAGAVNRALDAEGVTLVSLAPTMLERVLDARGPRPAPAALRCVLLGGGPAPLALLERAREQGLPVAPTYGLTEATSQVATRLPDETGPLDAGLSPLFGTEVRIATTALGGAESGPSEDGSNDPGKVSVETRSSAAGSVGPAAEPGEPGEILVRGGTVMAGYLNQPRASAEALRGGWLHTGDIGSVDERGRLRVLDRRSDLIVSGGENIYPAEVERALGQHPAVIEVGVAGVPDAAFGRRPAAWLVVRGTPPSDGELETFCRKRLAGYKVPVAFHTVDALPRNAAGKLLRRHLAAG